MHGPPSTIDAPEFGRTARCERHREAVQRNTQAGPVRLEVSFFSGPAKKEPVDSRLRRERLQLCQFACGEVPPCDVLTGELGSNPFYVDAETSSLGEGIHREASGMR